MEGPAEHVSPGETIDGRYQLGEILGKGSMGVVFAAEDLTRGCEVAIKLIQEQAALAPRALARFEREAVLSAQLRSPYVVRVLDHGHHDGRPYIAMERLRGVTLRQRLSEKGRLPIGDVATVLRHVGAGLTSAHELGLIHRDIKPENIFAALQNDDVTFKIFDFGVAKVTDALAYGDMAPTKTGALLGTPSYISPEQAQGQKNIDHRADLWSLGVVAFECLTGTRPFHARALGPLVAQVLQGAIPVPSKTAPGAQLDPAIDAWVATCLARDPSRRHGSALEMAAAFPAQRCH